MKIHVNKHQVHSLPFSSSSLCLQYRAALLSLMADVAVMLGAPEKEALTQMEKALAFETEVAHVKMSCLINMMSLNVWG